jgi:3'(2'), 5'-bisphosphate nucleotidase
MGFDTSVLLLKNYIETTESGDASGMKLLDPARLANALLPTVLKAGEVEMRHYASGITVEHKADSSPVTAADREAEAVLLDGLWHAARGVPVVAEESASMDLLPTPGTTFFVVDPLDGTREFVNRSGEFTVNIGLVVNTKPVFGIIYAPARDELFVTLGPGNAVETKISVSSPKRSLSDCPLTPLRSRAPDTSALTVLESRSHRSPQTAAFLNGYSIAEVKRAGSSLKFCLIARGEADFYVRIGPTMEWDTAAGQAILTAAGGTVTTFDDAPLHYGKPKYRNPDFIAWAREPIQSAA